MTERVMKADKVLENDINRAQNFEDLRSLLHNATERSGVATRDPETGQFVRRDPLTPADQVVAPADEKVTKTETIGGKEFTFTGTALEVERKIGDAYKVAVALKPVEPPATPRAARVKTQAEKERELFDRTELDLQFRRGELTTAEYLERTNAVGTYLAEKGFDVEAAASKQFEQSWEQATEAFFSTPEGQTWKGGQKNLHLANSLIISHGWIDAEDKVAALRAVAQEMRAKGLEFDGDYTPEQVNEMTDQATPSEILEAWKAAHFDAETANSDFINLHQGGRFFGK